MPPSSTPSTPIPLESWGSVLTHAAHVARKAGVFGEVSIRGDVLEAKAAASAAPAAFLLTLQSGRPWVALVTPDRYLSQSIEQDLVHTGDKLTELLEEELIELGFTGKAVLPVEHFRDDEKRFTFRTPAPADDSAATLLLAYEACFRRLGDMEAKDD